MRLLVVITLLLDISVKPISGFLSLPSQLGAHRGRVHAVVRKSTVTKGQKNKDGTDDTDTELTAREREKIDGTRRWTIGSLGGLAASLAVPRKTHAADATTSITAVDSNSESGSVVYDGSINKSPSDPRSYRSLTLSNGVEVLIVTDPNVDSAAAALNVHVGHYSDPEATPGLAHFCEHMLFLGTKSFPQEGAFESYLSSHGGRSNAFTGTEDTCYFFDMQLPNPRASGLLAQSKAQAKGADYATSVAAGEIVKQKAAAAAKDILLGPGGALQRFSGFFYEPLFTPSGAAREINAVDSENGKNLQQDSWRLGQLQKHTRADPRHPNFKFGTGTKETLSGDGAALRKQLVEFWEQNYLAPLMTLVVVSSLDANVVQGAVEKAFAPVPYSRSNGGGGDSMTKDKTTMAKGEKGGSSQPSTSTMQGNALLQQSRPVLPPESLWRSKRIPAFADPTAPDAPTPFVVLAKPVAPLRVLRLVWPLARPDPDVDLYSSDSTSPGADDGDSAAAAAAARAANAADLLAKPTLVQRLPRIAVLPLVISNLLGHEGPSSLLQYLRAQGFANALSSGSSYDSTDSATLEVEISLTGRGLEQWEEVASLTFAYLALLRSPNGKIPTHFMDECAKLADISWRFQERAPPMAYAESLATSIPELKASRGPAGVLGPSRYLDGRRLFLDPTPATDTSTSITGSGSSSKSTSIKASSPSSSSSSYKLVPPSVLAPLVDEVLAKMTPRAALLTLIAPEFTSSSSTSNAKGNDNGQPSLSPSESVGSSTAKRTFPVLNQREPWYGTAYGTVPIDDLLSNCQDDTAALKLLPSTVGLPKPNRFVPTQFAFKATVIPDDGGSALSPTSSDAAAAKLPAHAVAFRQLSSLQSRRAMFSPPPFTSSTIAASSIPSGSSSSSSSFSTSLSAFEAELTRPPDLILDSPKWRGWFKQDATFGGPRAILSVSIANPLASPTVEATVASKLWRACFVDRLAAEVYDATLAGLSYDVDVTVRGFRLTVIGPDQTLPDFALKVAKAARAFDPSSPPPGSGNNAQAALETFERKRELLKRDVESVLVQQPIQMSKYWESNLLERPFYSIEEYQAALDSATLSTVADRAKNLWQQPCNAQVILQGNVKRTEADQLFSGLQGTLTWQGGALPWSQRPTKRLALVPKVPQALALLAKNNGEGNDNEDDIKSASSSAKDAAAAVAAAEGVYPTIKQPGFDPSNANSVVTLTWQIPGTSPAFPEEVRTNSLTTSAVAAAPTTGSDRGNEPQLPPNELLLATAQLWAAAVNEPFFKALRTEQQLGYLVNSGLRNNDGVATFVLVVQSSKYGVDLMQTRMASFMATAVKEVLDKLSDSDVVALAKSESDKRKMRDKRLIEQVSRHFTEIETGTKKWNRADREAAALLQVDKVKLIAFYQRYLAPNSPDRRALAVHITSPASSPATAAAAAADSKLSAYVKDATAFKKALPNIPLRDPEMNQ